MKAAGPAPCWTSPVGPVLPPCVTGRGPGRTQAVARSRPQQYIDRRDGVSENLNQHAAMLVMLSNYELISSEYFCGFNVGMRWRYAW